MVVRKGAYASTLIALALAVGVPAQARIAANGITTNKISSNRIAANTLSSNRIAANTVSSNRLAGQRLAGKSVAANAGAGAFSEVTAIELPDGKLVTR